MFRTLLIDSTSLKSDSARIAARRSRDSSICAAGMRAANSITGFPSLLYLNQEFNPGSSDTIISVFSDAGMFSDEMS